jgi:hypothetical protein
MMSLTDDLNSKRIFSINSKHHITLIYRVHEDGYCGGGYNAEYFNLRASVGGELVDNMIDEAYDILEGHMEDEDYLTFYIKNIKKFVVFDLVECDNEEEQLAALDIRKKVTSYEEINKAVLQ